MCALPDMRRRAYAYSTYLSTLLSDTELQALRVERIVQITKHQTKSKQTIVKRNSICKRRNKNFKWQLKTGEKKSNGNLQMRGE